MHDGFGVMYVATGERHLAESVRSARSAKRAMPDIPISLWTDQNARGRAASLDPALDWSVFDTLHAVQRPRYGFGDKIAPLLETDYDKTLFVDADTYFIGSVYEIAVMLDRFELAYAHAPWRLLPFRSHVMEDVPICFPEPNTGVIAFRKSDRVMRLFEDWERTYARQVDGDDPPRNEQPALRKVLYESNVRTTVLPPEYNVRTLFPVFKGGHCPAKILHGRGDALNLAIETINRTDDVQVFDFRHPGIRRRLVRKLKRWSGRLVRGRPPHMGSA